MEAPGRPGCSENQPRACGKACRTGKDGGDGGGDWQCLCPCSTAEGGNSCRCCNSPCRTFSASATGEAGYPVAGTRASAPLV